MVEVMVRTLPGRKVPVEVLAPHYVNKTVRWCLAGGFGAPPVQRQPGDRGREMAQRG